MRSRWRRGQPAVLAPESIDREGSPAAAAALWSERPGAVEHVNDGASFTYRFTERGRRRYLRLTPPGWQSHAGIEAELAFMDCARDAGVRAPRAVPSRRGEVIEQVPGPRGVLLASVFEVAPGRALPVQEWGRDHARALGEVVARLHAASERSVVSPRSRTDWRGEIAAFREWLPRGERDATAALDEVAHTLELWPVRPGEYGLVHYDAQGSNVLWDGATAWLIDFDDCCFHWFAADLANALSSLRAHVDGRELGRAFLGAYRRARPLDEVWMERLPVLTRLRAIGGLAWCSVIGWRGLSTDERERLAQGFRDEIAEPGAIP